MFGFEERQSGWTVWAGPYPAVGITLLAGLATKGAAKKVSDALTSAFREATFKPKSAGKRSRTKGHSFERDVAQAFRAIFPKARRHLEYQDSQCFGVDLAETGPYRIQCKKLKKYAPITCIEEAEVFPELGEVPILVTAADGKTPMAVLPLEHLIYLMQCAKVRR